MKPFRKKTFLEPLSRFRSLSDLTTTHLSSPTKRVSFSIEQSRCDIYDCDEAVEELSANRKLSCTPQVCNYFSLNVIILNENSSLEIKQKLSGMERCETEAYLGEERSSTVNTLRAHGCCYV